MLGYDTLAEAEAAAPAFVLFRQGSLAPHVFDGPSADHLSLVHWVNRLTGSEAEVSSVVSLTPDNFERVTTHPKRNVLVQFFTPWYVAVLRASMRCPVVHGPAFPPQVLTVQAAGTSLRGLGPCI